MTKLVPIDCLKPGDKFVEIGPEPRLDVHFLFKKYDQNGDIIAVDEYNYEFHFNPNKIVRV